MVDPVIATLLIIVVAIILGSAFFLTELTQTPSEFDDTTMKVVRNGTNSYLVDMEDTEIIKHGIRYTFDFSIGDTRFVDFNLQKFYEECIDKDGQYLNLPSRCLLQNDDIVYYDMWYSQDITIRKFDGTEIKEATIFQISSIMECKNPTKKYNGGWSCGASCDSQYQLHSLEIFDDNYGAFICSKHIDYDKFEYDWGIVRFSVPANNTGVD